MSHPISIPNRFDYPSKSFSNYWKQKSLTFSTVLIDNYLKILSEKDFIEGDKQKILDTKSKYYTNEHERFRVEQIKLHQEILKSIKL